MKLHLILIFLLNTKTNLYIKIIYSVCSAVADV